MAFKMVDPLTVQVMKGLNNQIGKLEGCVGLLHSMSAMCHEQLTRLNNEFLGMKVTVGVLASELEDLCDMDETIKEMQTEIETLKKELEDLKRASSGVVDV